MFSHRVLGDLHGLGCFCDVATVFFEDALRVQANCGLELIGYQLYTIILLTDHHVPFQMYFQNQTRLAKLPLVMCYAAHLTLLCKSPLTPQSKQMKAFFPARLRELRGDKTRADVAKELGVSQQTYAQWELGNRQPKLQDLIRLALRYGVKSDWLLGLDANRDGSNNPRAEQAEEKLRAVKKSLIALVK